PLIVGPHQDEQGHGVGKRIQQNHRDVELARNSPQRLSDRQHGIKKVEERRKQDRALQRRGAVKELAVPSPEINLRADKCDGCQRLPVFFGSDDERAAAQQNEVGEQDDLLILATARENRGQQSAQQ